MRLQVPHRVPPQFNLLLNHFVHFNAFPVAWKSIIQVQPEIQVLVYSQVHLFVHFYIDLYVHLQMQSQFYYQVHPKLYHQATSNTFIIVSFALFCASSGALKSSLLLSFFTWSDFVSICTLKSIFERIFKCLPDTLSFSISVTFDGTIYVFLIQFQADYLLHLPVDHD